MTSNLERDDCTTTVCVAHSCMVMYSWYYVTLITLDDHPTTTVTVTDTDMGEGSGTSNLRLSTTVTNYTLV